MKLLTTLFLFCITSLSFCLSPLNLKVLHLTFHKGCELEVEAMAKELSIDLTTWFIHDLPPYFFDGKTKGSALYNIGHERAKNIWRKHKEYFKTFDVILTSDTGPLSRIFLQNDSKIPLVVWICNRFDYHDAASLDCNFPDKAYYDLFRAAASKPHVKIAGYTPFENCYAKLKNADIGNLVIKPAGLFHNLEVQPSAIPNNVVKKQTFFIPPYLNDRVLPGILEKIDIPYYRGRYAGRSDLKDFRGIIHIPYAWSNLALFENWEEGLVYFIPSKKFLLKLNKEIGIFWSPPFKTEHIELSEWYNPEYKDFFVYFDSWDDLRVKTSTTNYAKVKFKVQNFMKKHINDTLINWHTLFNEIATTTKGN